MSNGNARLAQEPMKKPGSALTYRTGVNKGPGLWFAVFLSLSSSFGPFLATIFLVPNKHWCFGLKSTNKATLWSFMAGEAAGF